MLRGLLTFFLVFLSSASAVAGLSFGELLKDLPETQYELVCHNFDAKQPNEAVVLAVDLDAKGDRDAALANSPIQIYHWVSEGGGSLVAQGLAIVKKNSVERTSNDHVGITTVLTSLIADDGDANRFNAKFVNIETVSKMSRVLSTQATVVDMPSQASASGLQILGHCPVSKNIN